MQMTAPMKKLMSNTMPMESTPSDPISRIYCRKNIRHLSGMLKTRPISCKYLPNAASQFVMNIVSLNSKPSTLSYCFGVSMPITRRLPLPKISCATFLMSSTVMLWTQSS